MFHPELKKTEVFLGNTQCIKPIPSYLKQLKTIRLGTIAFDIHGKKISQKYMLPLFLDKKEIKKYDDIMMQRGYK